MSASSGGNGRVRLSRRELEVAKLVAEGLTNREIATRLYISERTVDGHLEHVREKLGVNTRAQVATWVVRQDSTTTAIELPVAPRRRPFYRRRISRRWLLAAAVVPVLIAALVERQLVEPPGPTIVTLAGSSPSGLLDGGFSGDGGRATNALMSWPSAVAVSGDGSFYIADRLNGRIRRVSGGIISTLAGGVGLPVAEIGAISTSVGIGFASSVAIDPTGRLYFLTNISGMLEVWTIEPSRVMNLVASVGSSNPGNARGSVGGLAIGPGRTIYFSDPSANLVYSYAPGDHSPKVIAGSGQSGFLGDNGPATGAQLYRPAGLAVDALGNVYIADSGNNRIRKVDRNGKITTVAGSGTYYGDRGDGGKATEARLSFPFGVAVARDGTIYIADTGNNRVREVTPSGVIVALAGTGTGGFAGDGGLAARAELRAPEGVALDGRGDLYIADTLNWRVREVIGVPA